MATYQLNVNGQRKEVKVDPSTPLLWVLREELKLTGTKYGCGISVCGACTVHLDGVATRSCVVPISLVGNRPIVTIEGIDSDPIGRVVQQAWVERDVVQCGYCQSGQIMGACALLKANPKLAAGGESVIEVSEAKDVAPVFDCERFGSRVGPRFDPRVPRSAN